MLGLWGQHFQYRETRWPGSDPGQQHQDLQAHNAFPLGKEAERAGMWEYLRSLNSTKHMPSGSGPFLLNRVQSEEARFNGTDPTSASDGRAGSQVPILPSQAGSLECHGPDSEFIAC